MVENLQSVPSPLNNKKNQVTAQQKGPYDMQSAQAQINMNIRAVCSGPSQFNYRIIGWLKKVPVELHGIP